MERQRQKARAILQQQTAGVDPSEITALAFSDVALLGADELSSAKFPNLAKLTIVGMKPPVKDASALAAQFPSVKRLDISDNVITGFPEDFKMPNLVRLIASNNRIETLGEITSSLAKGCPKLQMLDLSSNAVEKDPEYPSGIFDAIGTLLVLDGNTKDGQEVESESDDDDDEDDEEEEGEGEEEEEEEEDEEDDDASDDLDGNADESASPPASKAHRSEGTA
jgi:hypothetical protein